MAHHFFVGPGDVRGGRVVIDGEDAHHAVRVLRLRPGETISVADGTGRVIDAVVTHVEETGVEARVIVAHDRRPPRPALTLFQGVAKGDRLDFVVQKAVELGARTIVPFLAERSIVKWDDRKREHARERLSGIARAAAKQCRSAWLTEVEPVAKDVTVAAAFDGPVLVLHEEAQRLLRDALPAQPPDALALVVGPEGGLAPHEVEALAAAGAVSVSLGERILRTETAGPVAIALVSFAYGSLG